MSTTKSQNAPSSILQLEDTWYKEVCKYLYTSNAEKGIFDNDLQTYLRSDSFVANYKKYNNTLAAKASSQPGAMLINDIWFTIPPQDIAVSINNNSIDIPQIRSKHSVKLDTGHGEISVRISLLFTANPLVNIKNKPVTLSDEIRYKLIPLLTQLRTMPFCHVRNEYLRKRLVAAAIEVTGDQIEDNEDIEIMLTYQSHQMETDPESPEIIRVTFDFLLFNYLPFMDRVVFVGDYKRGPLGKDGDNTIILRHPNAVNGKIFSPSSAVFTTGKSKAFYEFFAKEYKTLERRISDNGFVLNEYNHDLNNNSIEFQYFTYLELKLKYLTADQTSKVIVKDFMANTPKGAIDEVIIADSLDTTPSIKPVSGKITSKFGMRLHPIHKTYKMHTGIDIATGSPKVISAAAAGIISFVGSRRGYGNCIEIDHGSGYKTFYAHMSSFAVNSGQKVVKGQNIGNTGSTGDSTGIHLHYEVIYHGTRQDPEKYIFDTTSYQTAAKSRKELEEIVKTQKEEQTATSKKSTTYYKGYNMGIPDNDNINVANPNVLPEVNVSAVSKEKMTETVVVLNDTESKKTKEVQNFLNSLPAGSFDILRPNVYTDTIYVRIAHKWTVDLKTNTNFQIAYLSNVGYNEIPRIPLSGYKYATHQWLGGHVEKVNMNISINGEAGDAQLIKLQQILNIISDNTIRFGEVASVDGLGIKHGYINVVQGGNRFIVDNVNIQTSPEIPGASLVSIAMTDFTQVREKMNEAFGFGQENLTIEGYYKDLLQLVFSKSSFKISAWLEDRKLTNTVTPPSTDGTSIGTPSYAIHLSEAANAIRGEVASALDDNYKTVRWIANKYKDSTCATNTNTHTDVEEAKELQVKDCILKLIDELENISDIYWKSGQKDVYGINIHLNADVQKVINDNKTGMQLYEVLKLWVSKYSEILYKYFPSIQKLYPAEIKAEIGTIKQSAYMDFQLPPTITPDYYFYQPRKYFDSYSNQKKELRHKKEVEKIVERFQQYTKQLSTYSYSTNNDNIIKALIGNDSSVDSMKFYVDNNGSTPYTSKTAHNLTHEISQTVANKSTALNKKFQVNNIYPNLADSSDRRIENSINVQMFKNGQSENYLSYSEDDTFVSTLFKRRAAANSSVERMFDMTRCFPVYKIYIIEEDTTEKLYPLRQQDLNEMFGLNAIQEIRLVQHSDQPIDVITIRFIDLTGKFTSARYKPTPNTENKDTVVRDTELENPLRGIMLQEGTTIQCRMGYSNNINELNTVFNGQVTAIDGHNHEFEMICQSFGAELVYDIKMKEEPDDITTLNAETKEIINWCITQPEIMHFGRWKLNNASNLQFSEGTSGVNLLGYYSKIRPDGRKQLVWTWAKNEGDLNIMAPNESNLEGIYTELNKLVESPLSTIWSFIKNPLGEIYNGVNLTYMIYRLTCWDMIQEMTYRYPGYVAKVLPFDMRNTLFFGPPDSPYFCRSVTANEMFKLRESLNNPKVEAARRIVEAYTDYAKNGYQYLAQATDYSLNLYSPLNSISNTFSSMAVNNLQKYNTNRDKLLRAEEIVEAAETPRLNTLRSFRNYFQVTSETNLISNNMRADYRDVYTNIAVSYSTNSKDDKDERKDWSSGAWFASVVECKMNDFLQEEDIRTTSIEFPNCINEGGLTGAYRYGAAELWRQSKKLYKGQIDTLGEPSMKPYDYMIISDDQTDTYGPVEVRTHIISMTPSEGFISSVEPSMVSTVSDLVSMTNLDALMSMFAGDRGQDLLERSVGGILPVAGYTASAASAAHLLTGLGSVFTAAAPLSIGGIAVVAATSILWMQLASKVLQLAKNREPIYLQPVIRHGVPFIMGMNTYKTGGLIQWVENEFKVFNDGFNNFTTVFGSAIKELFET